MNITPRDRPDSKWFFNKQWRMPCWKYVWFTR
jgi:hypothetical protein